MSLEQDSDTPNFIDTEFEEVKRLKRSRLKGAHGLGGSSEAREFVESFLKDGIDSTVPDPAYLVGVGAGLPPAAASPSGFTQEHQAAGKDLIRHWSLAASSWRNPPGPPGTWPFPFPPPLPPFGLLPTPQTVYCRHRGGIATLCGFSEYSGHVSTPPNRYRQKTKTGSMNVQRSVDNNCSTHTTPGTIVGAKRGAGLTLIGHAEFATPSSPPAFYRRKTWSGHQVTQNYSDAGCATPYGSPCVNTESGAYAWNAAGAVIQNDGQYAHPSPCNPASTSGHGVNDGPFNWAGLAVATKTPTLWSLSESTCHPGACGGPASCKATSATNSAATLTEPDSETDAITRWLATSPAWSGYSACSGAPTPYCLARYQQRTTAAFNYQESKYNITAGGLNPSTLYHIMVDVYRSAYGAGSYSLLQTLILTATTDVSGNLALNDQIVPNAVGYDTFVTNALVLLDDTTVDNWNYTGNYNASSCGLTETDNSTRTVDGVTDPTGPAEGDYAIGTATTEVKTSTTRTLTGINLCTYAPRYLNDGFPWVKTVGTVTETLSDQDQEADAITRLLITLAAEWTGWHLIGDGAPGTCLPIDCCQARYEQRTGITFTYQESQWKAEWILLDPAVTYYGTLHVLRRAFGVDPFVQYEELLISGTPDVLGDLELELDVPNVKGFDTYVQL